MNCEDSFANLSLLRSISCLIETKNTRAGEVFKKSKEANSVRSCSTLLFLALFGLFSVSSLKAQTGPSSSLSLLEINPIRFQGMYGDDFHFPFSQEFISKRKIKRIQSTEIPATGKLKIHAYDFNPEGRLISVARSSDQKMPVVSRYRYTQGLLVEEDSGPIRRFYFYSLNGKLPKIEIPKRPPAQEQMIRMEIDHAYLIEMRDGLVLKRKLLEETDPSVAEEIVEYSYEKSKPIKMRVWQLSRKAWVYEENYHYNEAGQLVNLEHIDYGRNGERQKKHPDLYAFEYDAKGRLTHLSLRDLTNRQGNIVWEVFYEYDSQDLLKAIQGKSSLGALPQKWSIELKYNFY